jgi:uroporphyrinogen-III decarboxylase
MHPFPHERLSATREFLSALWALEDLPRPAFQINVVAQSPHTVLQQFHDKEKMLEAQFGNIRAKAESGVQDDYVPILFPYLGVTIFPSAFGCRVRWFENQQPWNDPIIFDDPSRVYELPRPSITDGQLGDVLEYTRYFVEQTGGELPVRMTDIQGPLDVAYLIWHNEDFMVAMYQHPREVHHLMRLVTELIIKFIAAQRALVREFVPCHYPLIWMPDRQGVSISDDVIALMSPPLYREFALPYVNQLSEAFNGVFIHTCGNFEHNFKNLEQIHKLRGLNFGASEMPFERVWERFGGKMVLIPHLGLNKEVHFNSALEYVEHVLRTKTTNRGLFILVDTTVTRQDDAARPLLEEDLQKFHGLIKAHS